jgi:hypothetical protein
MITPSATRVLPKGDLRKLTRAQLEEDLVALLELEEDHQRRKKLTVRNVRQARELVEQELLAREELQVRGLSKISSRWLKWQTNKVQSGITAPDNREPPRIAEFLLTALATTPRAESMVGDLNERFADECKKLGRDSAVRLYWARTLRSLWPLLRRAIGKALKWGAVVAALRRLF